MSLYVWINSFLIAGVVVMIISLVHETGHIVAGSLAGKKLCGVGISAFFMPFKLESELFGIEVSIERRSIGVAFVKFEEGSSLQSLTMLVGGPLANLLFFLVIYWLKPADNLNLEVLTWSSLGIGLLNLMPMNIKFLGGASDGWQILYYLRNLS